MVTSAPSRAPEIASATSRQARSGEVFARSASISFTRSAWGRNFERGGTTVSLSRTFAELALERATSSDQRSDAGLEVLSIVFMDASGKRRSSRSDLRLSGMEEAKEIRAGLQTAIERAEAEI